MPFLYLWNRFYHFFLKKNPVALLCTLNTSVLTSELPSKIISYVGEELNAAKQAFI